MIELVFWASAALVVYAYVGYPVLVGLLARAVRRPDRTAPIEPSVSILVAAYNEAGVIGDKIRNALALDYPADRLEIVIASDGSTDGTAAIARDAVPAADQTPLHPTIRVIEFERNRGKIEVLNDAVPQLRGEIVVFSDASSMLRPDALRQLVRHFADPAVGAASGVYHVLNADAASLGRQEDLYWKYETFLKLQEARLGTLTGAHGSLYAMRRELYPFPPARTINDDFVIPTGVLRHGCRIAYEPAAIACEEAREMEGFGRRVRITAGNIAQLREARSLVSRPFALFCFLSHKAGRVFVPMALVTMLAANALLVARPLYAALMAGQLAFYALALVGAFGRLPWKPLRLPAYFCMINAAFFVWAWQRLTGRRAAGGGKPGVVWT
jgi:cellulose synthase/poly-beta-1,6-N-acetylglucosamine synthase-like glycosyltransferase